MDNEINYKSNPLHGVSLKTMLTELVDHYGFEILYAYLYINCFKTNPSIASSVKFLNKTDWARENVESFYLYQYKNLPRASAEQYLLPPRDRVIPAGQVPGAPAELSLEDAERLRAKREKKADGFRSGPGRSTAADRGRKPPGREARDAGKTKYARSTKGAGPAKTADRTKVAGQTADEPVKAPGASVWGDADPWAKWRD
jgi:uncharacterized protein (DUF2132 family)